MMLWYVILGKSDCASIASCMPGLQAFINTIHKHERKKTAEISWLCWIQWLSGKVSHYKAPGLIPSWTLWIFFLYLHQQDQANTTQTTQQTSHCKYAMCLLQYSSA